MKKLILLMLFCVRCECAVSFHASAVGPNPNGGAFTTTLPTTSNNDVVIGECISNGVTVAGTKPYNDVAGWITLFNAGGNIVIYKVWHTADATTVVCTPATNGAASWETSIFVSYSGSNGTIDMVNGCIKIGNNNTGTHIARAPSTFPGFSNDMLAVFYSYGQASNRTATLPGALTSRQVKQPGPSMVEADKLLSTSAATGNLDATYTDDPTSNLEIGVQILIEDASPSGAAVPAPFPTIACMNVEDFATRNYLACFPNDKDLIVLAAYATQTTTSVSGFDTVYATGASNTGIALFTHQYATGDGTTYSFTNNASGVSEIVFRNPVTASNKVVVDTSGTNENAAGTTVASNSLTLKSTNEVYMVQYLTQAGTGWTAPGSINTLFIGQGNNRELFVENSPPTTASPTGTFTGTSASSSDLWAGSTAFGILIPASGSTSGTQVF